MVLSLELQTIATVSYKRPERYTSCSSWCSDWVLNTWIMNNKYSIHVYVGVYTYISSIHQTWLLQCMSVSSSLGTTDTQITQCKAYKYYLTMLALCPGALGFTKSIGIQHKNTKPFPCASNYTHHVYPDISKPPCICNDFGVSWEQSRENASIFWGN